MREEKYLDRNNDCHSAISDCTVNLIEETEKAG